MVRSIIIVSKEIFAFFLSVIKRKLKEKVKCEQTLKRREHSSELDIQAREIQRKEI